MRLIDLNPRFVTSGGEGVTESGTGKPVPLQEEVGLSFDCPCGCDDRAFITFARDKAGLRTRGKSPKWERTGDSFETLTICPSIQRAKIGALGCDWHGFITNGKVETC